MAGAERFLLGPKLLIGLLGKEDKAVQWAVSVQEADCVLSRLAIAIVRSVINNGATSEAHRQAWQQALNATVSRMEAGGATLVDVNETILEKFHVYRLHQPLDFTTPEGLIPVAQDIRLLITTADVMDLVYTEYGDVYLNQLQNTTTVRVQAL
ncbi:MAG: hypothetical protein EPN69_08345 [Rhodanobacter sp.]|nr:MAG: hypothetical protein EPN69_08345 [Rhodanobacter sp.]TAM01314.1 MAG: hypothetical protein EPN71_05675 [Rhodanobacter sp.]TAM39503.1 MAG: hypothetical protein EPN58_13560 [Rhodanobacter sp.]TAN29074.1 MAG: hypothetical protein EPN32_01630 [Rhodanobacter sp.]